MGKTLPPSPRDSHIAVIHGNSMFLFGGSTVTARNDLFEYKLEEKCWIEIQNSSKNLKIQFFQFFVKFLFFWMILEFENISTIKMIEIH